MPTYTFLNKATNERWTEVMSIKERDQLLEDNINIVQLIVKAPSIGDSIRLGIRKPDNGFREVLGNVKRSFPGGGYVNTF